MDEMTARWPTDPRPDFGDTALWGRLLAAAFRLDGGDPGGLFGALHGLRCWGARLTLGETGARLEAGEIEPDDYAALRDRLLVPRTRELRRLLAGIAA